MQLDYVSVEQVEHLDRRHGAGRAPTVVPYRRLGKAVGKLSLARHGVADQAHHCHTPVVVELEVGVGV